MAFLAPAQAKKYYDEILEIHFNRGSQPLPRKVVEYQLFLDEILFDIETVDKKTNTSIKGYDILYKERRSSENKDGTVSPTLWSGIQFLRGFRNDKSHNPNTTISGDEYRICLKAVAQAIEFLSEVPIPQEIIEVYSSTGNPYNPGPKASPKSSMNKPRPVEAIPEGLQYIKTFKGIIITGYTGNAASLVIPSFIESMEVTGIGPNAFLSNNSLQRIDLPETLETIGDNAFAHCYQLQQIYLPENVKTIGAWAFYNCGRLHTVSLPEKLENIDSNIFSYCRILKSMYLSMETKTTGDFSNVKLIYLD